MSKRLERDLMDDLAADASPSSAAQAESELEMEGLEERDAAEAETEDALEEADPAEHADDGFEDEFEEEAIREAVDGFTEAGETDAQDALEEAMADALDAEDTDAFFARLIEGISGVARTAGRGAGRGGPVAGEVGRPAERASPSARPGASLLPQVLPLLQQYAAQGLDEYDAFVDMVDALAEEEMEVAIPVLGGMAARTLVRPLVRRIDVPLARPVARQLVRGAAQAARALVRQQGPQAVRALPRLARGLARTAERWRLPVTALPRAIYRTAARVAAQPRLVRRLVPPAGRVASSLPRPDLTRVGRTRRFRLSGPVEIAIMSR